MQSLKNEITFRHGESLKGLHQCRNSVIKIGMWHSKSICVKPNWESVLCTSSCANFGMNLKNAMAWRCDGIGKLHFLSIEHFESLFLNGKSPCFVWCHSVQFGTNKMHTKNHCKQAFFTPLFASVTRNLAQSQPVRQKKLKFSLFVLIYNI